MRGEKTGSNIRRCDGQGSPPRARGKADPDQDGEDEPGITPACAGKSGTPSLYNVVSGDHPRVRGEKIRPDDRGCGIPGSPPSARGKAASHLGLIKPAGITPACAGKSPTISAKLRPSRDHPRVRGEKRCNSMTRSARMGSPPRARGKDCNVTFQGGKVGITPACAGKRHSKQGGQFNVGDHPRVRGEKFVTNAVRTIAPGSPPRARGKGFVCWWSMTAHRITPACAGKSGNPSGVGYNNGDHPRVRGEKTETHPLFAAFLRKTPIYTAILCR